MLTLNGITHRIPDVSVSLESCRHPNSNKLTIYHGLCATDKYVYLTDVQLLELAQDCLAILAKKARTP